MEHRADAVGKNAVYTVLRKILTEPHDTSRLGLRIFLVGHSFGCKVVLAALQDLQTDMAGGAFAAPKNREFKVVLLEPATDDDNLAKGDIYGSVALLPNLRLLMTKSNLDTALCKWFPEAGRAVNLFHPRSALGAVGPTQDTITWFGNSSRAFEVSSGVNAASIAAMNDRFLIADLTPVHTARTAAGAAPNGGIAGSHSDIYFSEVYTMISAFLFS